jgi:hypothetical protein
VLIHGLVHGRPRSSSGTVKSLARGALGGAAAGAAGTTALNAVTYLDMIWRARAASTAPEDTVRKLATKLHTSIPGEPVEQDNRVAGLGPLTGLVTGVGVGALFGTVRASGVRPGTGVGAALSTAVAMITNNGAMTLLGNTDPRTWSPSDWASDVLPHLAFGSTTAVVLEHLDRTVERRTWPAFGSIR